MMESAPYLRLISMRRVAAKLIASSQLNLFEFGAAMLAQQRLLQTRRQQLRVVQKIPSVIPFQAKFAFIGHSVCRLPHR